MNIKTYLTEYVGSLPSGRVAKLLGEIRAGSLEEAKSTASALGHTVLGELLEEIEAPEMKGFCDEEIRRRDEEWNKGVDPAEDS